ncbi:MAG: DUF3152 domain-containing protein [Propionibacteriales bacterium]|nr:DUF3152 domain-containing protein [Propionibacteriales bacterium]
MMWKSRAILLAVLLVLGLQGSVSAADPVAPVVQTEPAVTGTARVYSTLTADPGTWVPAAASYSYRWLRDGAPIPGATAPTYRLTGDDLTHQVEVRVVATGPDGGVSAPATSAPTASVGAAVFTVNARPTITGVRRWGRTLTAVTTGVWSPAPTTVVYRWFRDGLPIRGAVRATYRLTVADFGRKIAVRAGARRAFYTNRVVPSFATGPIGHRVPVRQRFTYSIATRGAITADLKEFAALTAQSYADPRGWRAAGYEFTRVARGGDFTLVLSSAAKVPSFGYPCSSTWSCRVGRFVIINQTRWLHASPAWNAAGLPLRSYRHMVLNHETGHWLGHGHLSCPGKGRLAPVMMQQSKGLAGCRFNPFPLASERWTSR